MKSIILDDHPSSLSSVPCYATSLPLRQIDDDVVALVTRRCAGVAAAFAQISQLPTAVAYAIHYMPAESASPAVRTGPAAPHLSRTATSLYLL